MKKYKYLLLFISFILLISPAFKTNSEEGNITYLSNKDDEKVYKIKLYNFDVINLNKIEDKLKIREVILPSTENINYKYSVKSTDYELGNVVANDYLDYLKLNSNDEVIVNNLYVKYIVVLNKYSDIKKALKNFDYKIVS